MSSRKEPADPFLRSVLTDRFLSLLKALSLTPMKASRLGLFLLDEVSEIGLSRMVEGPAF